MDEEVAGSERKFFCRVFVNGGEFVVTDKLLCTDDDIIVILL